MMAAVERGVGRHPVAAGFGMLHSGVTGVARVRIVVVLPGGVFVVFVRGQDFMIAMAVMALAFMLAMACGLVAFPMTGCDDGVRVMFAESRCGVMFSIVVTGEIGAILVGEPRRERVGQIGRTVMAQM